MLDWWLRMPGWLRYGIGLVLVGISAATWLWGTKFYPWPGALGLALLVVTFVIDD